MRITEIRVANYRSFDGDGVTLTLPQLAVPFSIIGPNNSGKSNLIRALLYGSAVRSVNDDTFTLEDFYLKDENREISIELRVDPPLKSSDIYNKITLMPLLRLKGTIAGGLGEITHNCCDQDGKAVYNPRALKRKTTQQYTEADKTLLNKKLKQGAEPVSRQRGEIPVHYIDLAWLEKQLKPTGYTLLSKVFAEIRREFNSEDCVMGDTENVYQPHRGQPRAKVFERMLRYINEHVLTTTRFNDLVLAIERVVKQELDITKKDFSVSFRQGSPDYFFDYLTFFITDHKEKPQLPVTHMGNGFLSLFVVALIRALVKEDDGGKIFIIEEPETYQHEHFQEYFYKVLCEIAVNNQVIYTTHSKKFVDVFVPESIIRLSNSDGLRTQVVYQPAAELELPSEIDGFAIKNPDDFGKYLRTLEPNVGNLAFAKKVLIVEGPHDLLAYRTVLETQLSFGLKNVAIVSAWGKDTIPVLVQLCKRLGVPYFVIHDWDIEDQYMAITGDSSDKDPAYTTLGSSEKAQYTKNASILRHAGASNVHHNKRNLEAVLGIPRERKSAFSVYDKLKGKNLAEVQREFPSLIPSALLAFLEIEQPRFKDRRPASQQLGTVH